MAQMNIPEAAGLLGIAQTDLHVRLLIPDS